MSDDNLLIKAIYETKCEQIQSTWLNPNTRKYINDGYAFAASVRMCPYFHLTYSINDPFENVYSIKQDFVKEVIKYLDETWLADKNSDALEFYNLETTFGGHHSNRSELIYIIRYCSLSDRFDNSFYNKIMSNAPAEANSGLNDSLDTFYITIP